MQHLHITQFSFFLFIKKSGKGAASESILPLAIIKKVLQTLTNIFTEGHKGHVLLIEEDHTTPGTLYRVLG